MEKKFDNNLKKYLEAKTTEKEIRIRASECYKQLIKKVAKNSGRSVPKEIKYRTLTSIEMEYGDIDSLISSKNF